MSLTVNDINIGARVGATDVRAALAGSRTLGMTQSDTGLFRAMHHRIVHLAIADARGHLMRAHVLRQLLRGSGIDVDIVTTQAAGADFLASLGTPSVVLPSRFRMELDDRHRLQLGRTRRGFLRYALADMRKDIAALRALPGGADLVVNDSFHPALLAAHCVLPRARVVHLHGDNLKRMVLECARPFRVERWLAHGFGEIVHTLDPVHSLVGHAPTGMRLVHLPPLVAMPRRSAADIRGSGKRIAAVYLSPYYRDPAIAALVERACRECAFELRGVSEPFAGRLGWCRADADFIDVVAAADVFISGAGMGALEQARVTGTPLVCLLGRQAEQTRNARQRRLPCVALEDKDALHRLVHALAALPSKRDIDASAEIARVHSLWIETFATLLQGARDEDGDAAAIACARDRNQQPARRQGRHRRLSGATARASAAADAPADVVG
jgi:hypothetical protein